MPRKNGDLTIEILKAIRDEVRATNQRLDQTNQRLDRTNERLEQTNERLERLERRQTESEVRIATELQSVVAAVNCVRDLLREGLVVRDRVEDHERRIAALEVRGG